MPKHRAATYNSGRPDVFTAWVELITKHGVNVLGGQELGDQGKGVERAKKETGATLVRKPRGGANRVGLLLSDVGSVTPLEPVQISGQERIEPKVAGNGPVRKDKRGKHKLAENKFIAQAEVDGVRYGVTHFIPSSARKTVTGKWKHPQARKVYAKQVAACVQWFATGGDVLLGDFNGVPKYGLLGPLHGVATCHTRPSHGKRSIDHIWVRKGSGITVDNLRALDGFTSDHRPVIADLTIPTPAPVPPPEEEEPMAALTQLADVLRGAGLKVVEHPGWKTRGRPGSFGPVGVLCHHTATGKSSSDKAVVDLLIRGRSDLPGPLSQLGLARDGTWHVIAAGRANHAGKAKASGTVAAGDGNRLYIGVEAFNDGRGEPWPDVQYESYVRGVAALTKHVTGNSVQTVRGHKETSVTGKIDPTFSMHAFRDAVEAAMRNDGKPKPKPKPKPRAIDRAIEIITNREKAAKRRGVKRRLREAAAYLKAKR